MLLKLIVKLDGIIVSKRRYDELKRKD